MASGRMDWEHEVNTDVVLAQALVAAQFGEWSGLPVIRVDAASTDNDVYRLGERLALRLPKRSSAVAALAKEYEWLPRLARNLTLELPLPIAKGEPAYGFPFPWSIVKWLEGAPPDASDAGGPTDLARDLGRFVATLHTLDASDGPAAGPHNQWRGAPLMAFDREMRRRFASMTDMSDLAEIVASWEHSLAVEPWAHEPVWVHGDLKDANLLCRNGALTGVLDWGLAGLGDPASDLSAGWSLFHGSTRATFRAAAAVDEATWARGRGWALIEGVFGLSYYRGRHEILARVGRRVIDRVLADAAA